MTQEKRKKLTAGIIIGALIGGLISAFVIFAKFSLHGKYAPGTVVANIDISQLTNEEAKAKINPLKEKYLNQEIQISLGEQNLSLTPKDLGINILTSQTLSTLDQINAADIGLTDLFTSNKGEPGQEIGLIAEIDYDAIVDKIENDLQIKQMAPSSAKFYFENGNQLAIEPEKSGQVLDRQKLISDIKNSSQFLDVSDINLILKDKDPAIKAADLEGQQEAIKEKLRQNISLVDPVYAEGWNIKLINHLDWVSFAPKQQIKIPRYGTITLDQPVTDQPADAEVENLIAIEVNYHKLNEYVDEELSRWLDKAVDDINITTDEEGQVIIEGNGKDGLEIDRKMLKQSLELALENGISEITIPTKTITADISIADDLQEMGIQEKLAVGHTSYYGSPGNRVHNIKVGADKFNGKIVAPGETFSFNQNLGAVDASTGYRKELVIKPEGTIPEYGGGICQVSTTLYRAVLLSGLEIAERNQHSYAVSYYSQILGHGLDATIYLGGPDLKFTNDTENHLLIHTYVDEDYELYVTLYGTKDGRNVELEGPYISGYYNPGPTQYIETSKLSPGEQKQVEKPHTGFSAQWYRHITYEDGENIVEDIGTRYKAVPAKILIGAEDAPAE